MNTEDQTPEAGLSRRRLLQRAAVAGAVAWSAPIIESFNTAAFASTGSPGPCTYYTVQIESKCYDVFGNPPRNNPCLYADAGLTSRLATAQTGGCQFVKKVTKSGSESAGTQMWTVVLDKRATDITGYAKCGRTGCAPATVTEGSTEDHVVFVECPSGPHGQKQGISNAELLFCVPAGS